MAKCHSLNKEQVSDFVLNWARLEERLDGWCKVSTKRNACPIHTSTSVISGSKQDGRRMTAKAHQLQYEVTTPLSMPGKSFAQTRMTVYAVAEKVVVSYGTCHKILHDDLNMRWVCGHRVPKNLTEHQMNGRAAISSDLIDMVDSDLDILNK